MLTKPSTYKLFNNPAAITDIVAVIRREYSYHIERDERSNAVYFVCPIILNDGTELGLRNYCSVDYLSHDVYDLTWFMKSKGTRCISIKPNEIFIMENNEDIDEMWEYERNVSPGITVLEHLEMTSSDYFDLLSLTRFILDIGKKIQDGR